MRPDLLHGVFDVAGFLDGVAQLLVELGVVPRLNCGHINVFVGSRGFERLALFGSPWCSRWRGHLFAEHGGRALFARYNRDEELVAGALPVRCGYAAKRLHEHVDVQFRLDDDHVPLFWSAKFPRRAADAGRRTG
ncbi:MAG: hypothetical protein ACLSTO_10335 [Bilophila wadsworthia]